MNLHTFRESISRVARILCCFFVRKISFARISYHFAMIHAMIQHFSISDCTRFVVHCAAIFILLLGAALPHRTNAQLREIDSLQSALKKPLQDTARVNTLISLARRLYNANPTKMDTIAHEALSLSERVGYERGIANALLQIGRSYAVRGRYDEGADFILKARTLFEELRDTIGISGTWHSLGNIYNDQTRYEAALQHYLTALRFREIKNDQRGIANTLNAIGIVFKRQRNYSEALSYYRRSQAIEEADNNRGGIASGLNNIALILQEQKQYDSAALYLRRSLEIERELGRKSGLSFSLNNLGVLFDIKNQPDSALIYLREALRLKQELSDRAGILFTQNAITSALMNAGRYREAVELAQKTLDSAQILDAKAEIRQTAEHLVRAYKSLGDYSQALFYAELTLRYRDTLFNLDRDRDLSRLDAAYKLEKKQHENDRLRSDNTAQRRLLTALGVGGLLALVFVILLVRMNAAKKLINAQLQRQQKLLEDQAQEIELANTALQEAHERSEQLLHNTLPAPIADRLKTGETKIAERFENVCILFADIVGFTELASRLEPVVLVAVLDEVFSAFDGIAARFGLEKIKTIGDAYMLVAGVPEAHPAAAEMLASAALAMQEAITLNGDILRRMNTRLQVRIGIHAGEVIAGVIGTSKLVYDLWGDAVNIAHRMESHGIAGAIQVSEAFVQRFNISLQERIDDGKYRIFAYPRMDTSLSHLFAGEPSIIDTATSFVFEERGFIEVKGKGMLKTYLLAARKMGEE